MIIILVFRTGEITIRVGRLGSIAIRREMLRLRSRRDENGTGSVGTLCRPTRGSTKITFTVIASLGTSNPSTKCCPGLRFA